MVQDVGFWEAVGEWWSGKKLDDYTMYGLPMLWWARIGKYLQFLGGAVVILDLIGPERFQQVAARIREKQQRLTDVDPLIFRLRIVVGGLGIITAAWFIYSVVAVIGGWFGATDTDTIPAIATPIHLAFLAAMLILVLIVTVDTWLLWFGKFIGLGKHGNIAKWIAFVLVVVGFHLDLLGS